MAGLRVDQMEMDVARGAGCSVQRHGQATRDSRRCPSRSAVAPFAVLLIERQRHAGVCRFLVDSLDRGVTVARRRRSAANPATWPWIVGWFAFGIAWNVMQSLQPQTPDNPQEGDESAKALGLAEPIKVGSPVAEAGPGSGLRRGLRLVRTVAWRDGRAAARRTLGKRVYVQAYPWVQIPLLPPA